MAAGPGAGEATGSGGEIPGYGGAGCKSVRCGKGRSDLGIRAGQKLVECYVRNPALNDRVENDRLRRQRILRWSILQHYEICDTPLLDVTQSIRIAASFASRSQW